MPCPLCIITCYILTEKGEAIYIEGHIHFGVLKKKLNSKTHKFDYKY